jgi:hypothetical protein
MLSGSAAWSGAAAAGVQAMIDGAAGGPTIAAADIDFACGSCTK